MRTPKRKSIKHQIKRALEWRKYKTIAMVAGGSVAVAATAAPSIILLYAPHPCNSLARTPNAQVFDFIFFLTQLAQGPKQCLRSRHRHGNRTARALVSFNLLDNSMQTQSARSIWLQKQTIYFSSYFGLCLLLHRRRGRRVSFLSFWPRAHTMPNRKLTPRKLCNFAINFSSIWIRFGVIWNGWERKISWNVHNRNCSLEVCVEVTRANSVMPSHPRENKLVNN